MNKLTSRFMIAFSLLAGLSAAAFAANDAFGVAQIYPTAAGGREWASKWTGAARTFTWGDDPQDNWDHGRGDATYSVDGQGHMRISGAVPRLYVYDPAM